MNEYLVFLLKSALRKNKLKVDEDELRFQLLSHPSYPSLHSVMGVLSHFSVEGLALELRVDEDTLMQLPEVFMAFIEHEGSKVFALITRNENSYELILDQYQEKQVSALDFLKIWTGITIVFENSGNKSQPPTPKSKQWYWFLIGASIVTLFLLFEPDLITSVSFALSIVGILISSLIIRHEMGFRSTIVDKACSSTSEITNCNKVLNSKLATLWFGVKLSDLTAVYFIGLSLSLLLSVFGQVGNTDLMAVVVIVPLPFTFYSIYYQSKVVGKWCTLCIGIIITIWLQVSLILLENGIPTKIPVDAYSMLIVGASFLLAASGGALIISKLKTEQEFRDLKIEYYSFKRNYNVFKKVAANSDLIDKQTSWDGEIVLGNKEAQFEILLITNPLCGHCMEAHRIVKQVLDKYSSQLNIRIRFNVNIKRKGNPENEISARLLEILETQSQVRCLDALHDIYSGLQAEEWLLKWGAPSSERYNGLLELQRNWCLQNNFNFTPEIVLNGTPFPSEYQRADLLYFIDELLEDQELNSYEEAKLQEMPI